MRHLGQLASSILIGGGVLLTAVPAHAQEHEIVVTGKKLPSGYVPVTTAVRIGDLNLSRSAGVKEMQRRVARAVSSVCPAPPSLSESYEERDFKLCRDYAWASARPQMERAVQRATQRKQGNIR